MQRALAPDRPAGAGGVRDGCIARHQALKLGLTQGKAVEFGADA